MTTMKAMITISFVFIAFFLAFVCPEQFPVLSVRRVQVGEPTPQLDQLYRRTGRQPVGRTCKYADDCISGCCTESSLTRQRFCKPLSLYGQRCDEYQLKGGYYWNYCPCEAGEGYCSNNVCSA